jgi:hypothetical protein
MIQINGQESEPGVVKMGVVQGGVLSTTLFNIYVNDMFGFGLNGIIQMCASSLDEFFKMINEDLANLA